MRYSSNVLQCPAGGIKNDRQYEVWPVVAALAEEASEPKTYLLCLATLSLHQGRLHPDSLIGQRASGLLQNSPCALHLIVLKFNLEGRQPDLLALCGTNTLPQDSIQV